MISFAAVFALSNEITLGIYYYSANGYFSSGSGSSGKRDRPFHPGTVL
jgi:hypothetical protein